MNYSRAMRTAVLAGIALAVFPGVPANALETGAADDSTVACRVKNPWGQNIGSYALERDDRWFSVGDDVKVRPTWYSSTSKFSIIQYRINVLIDPNNAAHPGGTSNYWERLAKQNARWSAASYGADNYEDIKGVEVVATTRDKRDGSTVLLTCKNFFY